MKKALIILCLCSLAIAQDKPYRSLNSFGSGALSELLSAREDLSKYHSGCSVMENFIPLPQGGAEKRPGTVYVAESKENTKIRLIPFQYSTEKSFIVELGNQYARFFTDSAPVNTGNGTETLAPGNIIAHYLLNETIGTTVADDDGATHNGTATADCSILNADGKVGTGCFDLDAQYTVEMSDHADFSFTDNSNDSAFSISCWAYVTQQTNTQNLISKWRDDSLLNEWRFSLNNDRKLQLHLSDSGYDLTSNRIAHWKLNEDAANKTVLDDDATSHDGLTQTNNTGVLTATGIVGKCLDFGGADCVVITNDHDELSFGDSTNDSAFSISAWVYVTDGDTQSILSKYDATAGAAVQEWLFLINVAQGLSASLIDKSANSSKQMSTDDALTTGWHHVVLTYSGVESDNADDSIILYVDSVAVSQTGDDIGTYIAMENTATKVVIGAAYDSSGNLGYFFEDKIDNVMLLNIELTQAHVDGLYNDGGGTEDLTVSNALVSAISDDAISVGWHHLVCTYSAPADETTAADGIILYVDAAVVDSTATNNANYTAMQNGAEEIRIGSQRNSADSANEKFWGDKIDAVAVFGDVLTPSEISTLYDETPYEIETPYLTADLFELKFEQSADVLYITHPDYEPRKLSRNSDVDWTMPVYGAENGPFRDQNTDEADTITASATTGSITLTATGCTPFLEGGTAGHEPGGSAATSKSQTGALFRLTHPVDTLEYSEKLEDNYTNSQVENTSWLDCGTVYKGTTWYLTTLGTWTGVLEIQRNYTVGAAHGASGWEKVFAYASTDDRNVSTNSTEDEAAASYRAILTESGDAAEVCKVYFRTNQTDHDGIIQITGVASPTSATATVLTTLGSTNATHKWSEGSWSNYRGWPRTVTFFEDRLTFGGNISQPDTIWASVTADYENMTEGADDDSALLFTLSSREVNIINWLVGKNKILIGTSGAEWTLAGSSDEPLTPSNVKAEQHSTYGSADLQSTLANESVLFFQRGAEKMRELAYNWELDSYVAPEMTILVPEITGEGITDTAYQQTPNPILWCVKENGEIAIFVYERKEQITSWSTQITDGDFESVAVISGDAEDQVWISVERVIGGNTKRYIEYFSERDFGTDLDDAFYVDCGITYDSTATTTITGLDHLEGETVAVLGDGAILDNETVASGQITIDESSTVQAGLLYEAKLRTMPLSWIAEGMTIQGRIKRINQVIARYYNSGDFNVGRSATIGETISISGMDTDEQPITFPAGYDRPGYVYVYQNSAEPLTLLALMVEFMIF